MNRPSKINPAPAADLGCSPLSGSAATCPDCKLVRCLCPWPGDEDLMPAADVNRIMREWRELREERERIHAITEEALNTRSSSNNGEPE